MESLVIKNYKNFKNLTLENLTNVNLIVGKNNVGKSSLLEAIFILGMRDNNLGELFMARGEQPLYGTNNSNKQKKDYDRYISLFPDNNSEISDENSIQISSLGKKSNHNISYRFVYYVQEWILSEENEKKLKNKILNNKPDDGTEFKVGLQIKTDEYDYLYEFGTHDDENHMHSTTMIDKNGAFVGNPVFPIVINFPIAFIRSNEIRSDKDEERWSRILYNKKENYVVNALKIINKDIQGLDLIYEHPRKVIYVDVKGKKERQRLTSMGDGANRILTIILAMFDCKDGVFLIDEFENGLHHSVQSQLWKIIFELSHQLKIQVFVTTHSEDTIKCFAEIAKHKKGKIIRLENKNDSIRTVDYEEKDELDFIAQNKIEIR